jgi:hypothetical protein
MKPGFSEQVFEEYSKIKFHENPSSGSELFHADGRTDGRTDGQTDRQTDRPTGMTKLIVALLNFANVPKNVHTYITNINSVNLHSDLQGESNQT